MKKVSFSNILVSLISIAFVVCLGFNDKITNNNPTTAYNVYVDGEKIGTVESEEKLNEYINNQEEKLMENKSIMLEYLAYYILQDEGIEELEEDKTTEISMINFDNIDSITELEDELHEIIEE